MNNEDKNSAEAGLMRHRTITLEDGRYMIFYTFAESLSKASVVKKQKPEPAAGAEAPENKNV